MLNTNLKLLITCIFFASCSQTEVANKESILEEIQSSDIEIPSQLQDTTKKQHEIIEQKENLAKIEQKYGEQWGFCECVVANDSIDRAVKALIDFETPAAEKLLDRFDYVAKKCQAFLGMDANRTPEERLKHEKKVKRCLKQVN